MKKNTIFIVIDSVFYDKTIKQNYRNCPMPFLNKLRKESLDFANIYSEAPYTEAALVSLLCGMDTLKGGGYLKKLKGKETIMETFKKNGYETFCNCIQPLVYPSYSYEGVVDGYYNICYDFNALWSYRLEFYSKIYKEKGLDNKTLEVIIELLQDNLKTWKAFFEGLKNKDKFLEFIYKYIDITDLDLNLTLLLNEYKLFEENKLKYTKKLLEIGTEHNLFKIHTYNLSKKLSEEDMKEIYNKYKKIIIKMFFKNFRYNLKNNKLILGTKEERKGLLAAYVNAIFNRFLYQKIDYKIKSKKAAPSMDTTINHFKSWLLNRESDKPYFAYIHIDDCHRQEMFYTYDTNDFNKLDEEFNAINSYMKKLPRNYKGNISYDVSLQYADICLKRLYDFLEENNMLDNINIVITADHGSSYTFAPYRSNYVNNVHRENYNMPLVIWNKDLKPKQYNGFYQTKDIPATILDLNNIDVPDTYDGYSVLKNKERDYVILENVNGGCPDLNLRDILLGVRTKRYLVVLELNLFKEFDEYKIHSVYNLVTDKDELYNLNKTIDKSAIVKELSILKDEFELLKEDYKKQFD